MNAQNKSTHSDNSNKVLNLGLRVLDENLIITPTETNSRHVKIEVINIPPLWNANAIITSTQRNESNEDGCFKAFHIYATGRVKSCFSFIAFRIATE